MPSCANLDFDAFGGNLLFKTGMTYLHNTFHFHGIYALLIKVFIVTSIIYVSFMETLSVVSKIIGSPGKK